MAIGQTYVLKHFQTFPNSGDVLNRYYYQQIAGTDAPSALILANAFVQNVFPLVQDIQSIAVLHERVEVYNADDLTDFASYIFPASTTGNQTGEYLPGFVSWTFRFARPFRSFRSGRKAFVGVTEGNQINGVPISGFIPLLQAAATALAEVIGESGIPNEYAPVLVKNIDQPIPIREVAQIMNCEFVRISTQNTRK